MQVILARSSLRVIKMFFFYKRKYIKRGKQPQSIQEVYIVAKTKNQHSPPLREQQAIPKNLKAKRTPLPYTP